MSDENEKQGARDPVDYKAESKKMLADAYAIAASGFSEARTLTDNHERKGVAGWLHIAEQALNEIIRLTPMCGQNMSGNAYEGIDFDLPAYDDNLRGNN